MNKKTLERTNELARNIEATTKDIADMLKNHNGQLSASQKDYIFTELAAASKALKEHRQKLEAEWESL